MIPSVLIAGIVSGIAGWLYQSLQNEKKKNKKKKLTTKRKVTKK